jgi:hypothetical protein
LCGGITTARHDKEERRPPSVLVKKCHRDHCSRE